ncbi:MAG: efflux RND transporter permease subunit [Gammaproteobacteria bacterium]
MSSGSSSGYMSSVLARLYYRNRYALALSMLVIILAGWSALTNLPRIEDPRITNRFSRIVILLPGASAKRVEALVTDPVEEVLQELTEIKKIESTSRANVSTLSVELEDWIQQEDTDQIYSKIRNQLRSVSASLPAEASEPVLDDKVSAVAYSLIVSVNWPEEDSPPLNLMNRLAEELGDQLRLLPGTDVVRFFGAPKEEISVVVDSNEMAAMGITVSDLAQRISQGDPKAPAGALRTSSRDLLIEVAGELDSTKRVSALAVATTPTGGVVTLGDVAQVQRRWQEPPQSIAYTNEARSILVAVHTEPDVRIDKWAETARKVVEDFKSQSAEGVDVNVVFEQSNYTEQRLMSLSSNLLAGAGLVMLVVFFGMGWRAALVVGLALPLSASLTLFGLTFTSQQIHQMSIFGMIVAIGLLIDNAIVMTDEIKQLRDKGMKRLEAVEHAVRHLFVPLLASTLTTVLAFMPVFLLPGAAGDFVGPIALAVVLALCASFFVSISIIPAMAGMILPEKQTLSKVRWLHNGIEFESLGKGYRNVLRKALKRPFLTAFFCMLPPIAGFVLSGTLNQEFFPAADRDQFEVELYLPAGSSILSTQDLVGTIEHDLLAREGIKEVHALTGGTFPTIYYNRIMRIQNDNTYAHLMVYTDSVADASRLVPQLQSEYASRFVGAQVLVKAFAQGPPVNSPVGYRIEGPDIETLRVLGNELRRIMHTVPDISSTRASVTGGQAKLNLEADDEQTRLSGLTLTQVAAQLQTSLEGQAGGSVLEDVESLPVRIRLNANERNSIAAIRATKLVSPATDRWLSLESLGDLKLTPNVTSISHYNGQRVNRIFGYINHGAFAIDVTAEINQAIEDENFSLPNGYQIRAEGDAAEQGQALGNLLIYLPILLMLMISTLVLSFRSVTLGATILVVAVLSVGHGLLALWMGQYALGFNAIIGSVGLVGVAINGTIVVLASIRSDAAASNGDTEAIVQKTAHTTRHIVSTTLTTVGGFAPLLLFSDGEFWPPLAIVMAGGVLFSIILSLFFAPAVYQGLGLLRGHFPALFLDRSTA